MMYHGIGTPYYTMVYNGTTVFAIVPGFTVVYQYHGIPWYTMVCTPWYTMVNHGKLWYDRDVLQHGRTMVYHGMVYHHCKPWYTIVYHAYTTV